MGIRVLKEADGIALEGFLRRHAESSMFLLSNLRRAGVDFTDRRFAGAYYASFSENGMNGVIAHYWNGNLVVQAPNKTALEALCAAIRNEHTRPVAGVLGPDTQARRLLTEFGLDGEAFVTNRCEGLYALHLTTLATPPHPDAGTFEIKAASAIDRSLLFQWLKAYDIEALGSSDDADLDARMADRVLWLTDKTADCWALVADGQPVCLCGFNARLPDMVQIGPVWTPPEHRGRHYARHLLARVLETARADGVAKAILFTDNPAAITTYEAIGFRRFGDYRLAMLQRPVDSRTNQGQAAPS